MKICKFSSPATTRGSAVSFCFLFLFVTSTFFNNVAEGAVSQSQEGPYLAAYDQIMEATYSQVDDSSSENGENTPPPALLAQCKNGGSISTREVTVDGAGVIPASDVQNQCGTDTICIIPEGVTVRMDSNLNVGAMRIHGGLDWTAATSTYFLCGGYIVVERSGSFEMELLETSPVMGWIYIKNNGAEHSELKTRSFGIYKETDYSGADPVMKIRGRHLHRTWSLLAEPLSPGMTTMRLMHNPNDMGWKIGDRLGIAPTESRAHGWGQDVRIVSIDDDIITLNEPITHDHRSDFDFGNPKGPAALLSAEVVNLNRNIVLTGDDHEHIRCDRRWDGDEAVIGEKTSVNGCMCSDFRTTCTVGLHSIASTGGVMQIENIRVEKCGQRGIEGKYCMHFHRLGECKECVFRNNAIENSQQRGIIVHGTHNSLVENNVMYNVRGANFYVEDGNEMWNTFAYNVAICPFPFSHDTYHGCTIPGTSNRMADTSDNQSGFFSRAGSNSYIGNRAASHFNGMFLSEGSRGRGAANNQVCESAAQLGRMDGNTWHDNGRFGTYCLGYNYPKVTDQSVATNGFNVDRDYCEPFDAEGDTRGLPGAFVNHVDYGNSYVGHYMAGDLQHYGHHSTGSSNLMYWKVTKTIQNGCGSNLIHGYYANGNMLLPDQATFIIDNVVIGDGAKLEANHHCNVGTTGVLCMSTYILHKLKWKNSIRDHWMGFQHGNDQKHDANQNHGGIFTLSPEDAGIVISGGTLDDSVFPPGYVSLVSNKFQYLLGLPDNMCILTAPEYGNLYDEGIMCKTELRALKIYSRNLLSGSAPQLNVEVWYKSGGISGQRGSPDASQLVGFHQVGADNDSPKQGYSVPVVPGTDHSYKISLTDGDLPTDWVIEFSDPVIGNRWSADELYLKVAGRDCGNNGLVTSQHDRKFIWAGDINSGYLNDNAWSNHGACVGSGQQPADQSPIDCSVIEDTNQINYDGQLEKDAGVIEATQCPEKCQGGCNPNMFCACGLEECQCKAGFIGSECETDICADANCGEHGSCSARYLGGDLIPTNNICICQLPWRGEQCDKNPCEGIDCSGNGRCVAVSDTEATCDCEEGYLGAMCEDPVDCACTGSFPFYGCSSNIGDKYALGCFEGDAGGCASLNNENSEYPYAGFCTYKMQSQASPSSASRPTPTNNNAPIAQTPTNNNVPTAHCGCNRCTDDVWNALAGEPHWWWGEYSCGDRITHVEDTERSTEEEACRKVTDEYPDVCTCTCDDDGNHNDPIDDPAPAPTNPITVIGNNNFNCGCSSCTDDVLNNDAGGNGNTCGSRIDWLQTSASSSAGGPMDEKNACRLVSGEFTEECGRFCHPDECVAEPLIDAKHCGCSSCTDSVWDAVAEDHSCGSRIEWLQANGEPGGPRDDEEEACRMIAEEYPEICGRCRPNICSDTTFTRRKLLRGID